MLNSVPWWKIHDVTLSQSAILLSDLMDLALRFELIVML